MGPKPLVKGGSRLKPSSACFQGPGHTNFRRPLLVAEAVARPALGCQEQRMGGALWSLAQLPACSQAGGPLCASSASGCQTQAGSGPPSGST